MEILGKGILEALRIFFGGDAEVASIALLSLRISCSAVAIAVLVGVPLGTVLAWGRFWGRRGLLSIVNACMGLPPVVAGLLVVMLLWRGGVLECLDWLYTPNGMILAQVVIALPIIAGLSASAYQQQSEHLKLQLYGLGASRLQMWWLITREARLALLAAVMAALGRVLAEVGAVIMVGGNIKGHTRVLTTAIVLETRRGNFPRAVALAIVLMLISLAINAALTYVQQRGRKTG